MQCVIVLPHPAPPPTSQSSHASFKQFLEYLHALPQRSRAPMTVLPPLNKRRPHQGVDAPRDCIIHIRELWIERIDGGPGCWADALPDRPRSRYC